MNLCILLMHVILVYLIGFKIPPIRNTHYRFGRLDCEHESPQAMRVNHFHHTLFVITLSRFWIAVRLGDLCSKPDSVHIIMFRFM